MIPGVLMHLAILGLDMFIIQAWLAGVASFVDMVTVSFKHSFQRVSGWLCHWEGGLGLSLVGRVALVMLAYDFAGEVFAKEVVVFTVGAGVIM
jgi:hypothetical protein